MLHLRRSRCQETSAARRRCRRWWPPSAGTRCCRRTAALTPCGPWGAPRPTPRLTRSSLHRCLQRHGISRLPDTDGAKPQRSRFKRHPIGFLHRDLAEVRTAWGRRAQGPPPPVRGHRPPQAADPSATLRPAAAGRGDRTSKPALAQLVPRAGKTEAARLRRAPIATAPYRIPTVLADPRWPGGHRSARRARPGGREGRPARRPHARRREGRGLPGGPASGAAPPGRPIPSATGGSPPRRARIEGAALDGPTGRSSG